MVDLNARLCDLPVELKALILSYIEHVKTHHILALSSTVQEAFSLLRALQQAFYFEGAPSEFADHLVHLLGDDRVRSMQKECAVELIGDDKDRLCEYACGRNFEVLKWAHNELKLPWAYPAARERRRPRATRATRVIVGAQAALAGGCRAGGVEGVKMVDGRVVELGLGPRAWNFHSLGLCAVPAEIGQLTSLVELDLHINRLTSVPAEMGQLTSLVKLNLKYNWLTNVPAEIGRQAK